ncbi:DNA sulfur modification protein DndB [Streptomyces sp. ADMS]|uniref:DNA sulfur modification protein DndB n=1 Tax=Streptomyces sp. ADMS TaxID=3071415 RepID=UPI00296E2EAB|nr:DNA sulfur modification protein DndB [Streptomyces sp. ADMS]MDW4909427.1 DNA sulfur modification protein DndB [Streptomyces sp. ADMS]
MFGSGTKLMFRDYVQGTWGSFDTPAGRVDYIMTKARLGGPSDTPERQLTKSLAPVREVMDAGDLDFNQLLQRDLDDHRVAVNLIPYLLKPQAIGPAFFPPIVAVLLPFQDGRPTSFSALGDSATVRDDDAMWQEERAGSAFQIHRLLGADDKPHAANVGKLWWNQSEARLVVLDGQHRAMALLAVERTISNSWKGSAGVRFRSFYEHQVKQALQDHSATELDLAKVEVPVTVCWFPQETGETSRPHEAARKLFVDVNKEARPPSESRIILLSDAELANVLTRSMLSELRSRSDASYLPLYAVEYDNPEVNTSRTARWSVMTNINLLKMAVNRCVFGPAKYLTNVAQMSGGRESPKDRDDFMRQQLDVASLFPEKHFQDSGFSFDRDTLGDKQFPIGCVDLISDRFTQTWGKAILTLLSKTTPYAAHAASLTKLKDDWHVADTFASLAHDALFGGVGVFWTLRDSHEHYVEHRDSDARRQPKSDVIRAWEALRGKESDFDEYRAQAYLGSVRLERVKACKAAYSVLNTHACQLGLVLTLGSLWELRKVQPGGADLKDLPAFAESFAAGLNAFFQLEHGKGRDRKLAFNKNVTNPINQIVNMDTPQAAYFRYFWMQALAVPQAWEHVESWLPDRAAFNDMLGQARRMYLELCTKQQLKALSTSRPGVSDKELFPEAEKVASAAIRRGLRDWFYVTEQDYEDWLGRPVRSVDQRGLGDNMLDFGDAVG